jgi:hypothetical protein
MLAPSSPADSKTRSAASRMIDRFISATALRRSARAVGVIAHLPPASGRY